MPSHNQKHNFNGEFRALYDAGYSDYAIGKMQGCRKGVVWQWRKKNNLPARRGTPSNLAVIHTEHFNFRSFATMLDKAVEDAGVSIHTLEGRKCRDGLFNRFEAMFMMDWRTT